MNLNHSPTKEICRLFILHHTKIAVVFQQSQPIFQSTKFHIFNTAWCCNHFDFIHRFCKSEPIQLRDFCNSLLRKEILDIAVETGRLKETVTEQNHTMLVILRHCALVDKRLTIPDAILHFNILWFRGQPSIVAKPCRNHFIFECTCKIINHKETFRPQLNCPDNAAQCQCNVRLESSKIHFLPLTNT